MAQQVRMTVIDQVASWLILAGALNWGSISFFSRDLVQWLASSINMPDLAMLVYKAVGIAAVYFIYRIFRKFK